MKPINTFNSINYYLFHNINNILSVKIGKNQTYKFRYVKYKYEKKKKLGN